MNFSEALEHMKKGEKVRRECWGPDPFRDAIEINPGDATQIAYTGRHGPIFDWAGDSDAWDSGHRVREHPVVSGHVDILADDWEVVNGK